MIQEEVEKTIFKKIYLPLAVSGFLFSLLIAIMSILISQYIISIPFFTASLWFLLYYYKVKKSIHAEEDVK